MKLLMIVMLLTSFSVSANIYSKKESEKSFIETTYIDGQYRFEFCHRNETCQQIGPQYSYSTKSLLHSRDINRAKGIAEIVLSVGAGIGTTVAGVGLGALVLMALPEAAFIATEIGLFVAGTTGTFALFNPLSNFSTAKILKSIINSTDLYVKDIYEARNQLEKVLRKISAKSGKAK